MSNPYQTPVSKMGMDSSMQQSFHPMQPLADAAGWMKFLGWTWIIMGGLYCLTIIGIIPGGIMLWMGICVKGAGEKTQAGFPNNNALLYEANKNLATYFTIMAILLIISLVIMALYLIFAVGVIAFGIAGAAGAGGM